MIGTSSKDKFHTSAIVNTEGSTDNEERRRAPPPNVASQKKAWQRHRCQAPQDSLDNLCD